jgi:hypothetical protein
MHAHFASKPGGQHKWICFGTSAPIGVKRLLLVWISERKPERDPTEIKFRPMKHLAAAKGVLGGGVTYG